MFCFVFFFFTPYETRNTNLLKTDLRNNNRHTTRRRFCVHFLSSDFFYFFIKQIKKKKNQCVYIIKRFSTTPILTLTQFAHFFAIPKKLWNVSLYVSQNINGLELCLNRHYNRRSICDGLFSFLYYTYL